MAWVDIDSDATADDEAVSSAIAVRARANLSSVVEQRPFSASRAWLQISSGLAATTLPPWLSTHPEEWCAVPVRIPAESLRGSATVRCRILYEVAQESVEVRLRVGDQRSSASTLAVTGAATRSVELSVTAPRIPPSGDVLCALEYRSIADATATAVTIEQSLTPSVIRVDADPTALTADRCARVLEITPTIGGAGTAYGQTLWYVGAVHAAVGAGLGAYVRDLRVWPLVSPESGIPWATDSTYKDSGNLYDLGVLRLRSMAIYGVGDAGSYPAPPRSSYEAGAVIRARDVHTLDRYGRSLYQARSWVLSLGTHAQSGCIGIRLAATYTNWVHTYTETEVAYVLSDRRADATGFRWTAVYAVGAYGGGSSLDATWTATAYDLAGNSVVRTETTRSQVHTARTSRTSGGLFSVFGGGYSGGSWGAADAPMADEIDRLDSVSGYVPYHASTAVGDAVALKLTCQGAPVHVMSVTISEVRL